HVSAFSAWLTARIFRAMDLPSHKIIHVNCLIHSQVWRNDQDHRKSENGTKFAGNGGCGIVVACHSSTPQARVPPVPASDLGAPASTLSNDPSSQCFRISARTASRSSTMSLQL